MNKKICLCASSGGHFEQLMMLKPIMKDYNCFIITEDTSYSANIKDRKIYFLKQINRKEISFIPRMLFNIFKSIYIYFIEKPDIVITTGVLAMIPISLIIKLAGKKLVYIESYAKVTSPTVSGKFLYRFADKFYVQWEEMLKVFPKATYKGGIY
jgi:UDP-N-acetylglucosamine:LPS N-acetylglucosamine transferase